MKKVHLGCGTIFLEGYINVDASPHYIMPNVPKDILEQNSTTVDNYYKHNFCKGSGICVVDVEACINNLPFKNCEINEIILLHVLEHIPHYNLTEVLSEINRVLKIGGTFRVGVPDVKETAKLLCEAKTPEEEDWCIRLLYGTQRNKWSHHCCGYTERTLKETLEKYGFGSFISLPNINFYPAIHITAEKMENYEINK